MLELWYSVESFIERGGQVLWLIALTLFLMWTLILERLWYFRSGHREQVERVIGVWNSRDEKNSWHARQVRSSLISQVRSGLAQGVGMIQSMVALCPLLGLLGTVTGMIGVFEIMSLTGSSNARLMAEGVSKATIPTMSGMVAALSGLYFSVTLQNYVKRETDRIADMLTVG
ncbi:MAG: MotA/TolQ/ExbB proton channel family protein [Proteobacteria bacterium]|nr:MotA/TolQ/ExbB proton channel family protein [Pseudomonadota bacterium]